MKTIDSLIETKEAFDKKMASQLRDYVKTNKENWQKIPYLALQADGRNGFNSRLSTAYEYGLWKIDSSTYVDLQDAEIVDIFCTNYIQSLKSGKFKLASEKMVSSIVGDNGLYLFDVNRIISSLEKEAQGEDRQGNIPKGFETKAEWRKSYLHLGLEKDKYTRMILSKSMNAGYDIL